MKVNIVEGPVYPTGYVIFQNAAAWVVDVERRGRW